MQDSPSDQKNGSVAQNSSGFTVAASPFNPVKLELGIILILAIVVLIVHDIWISVWWGQLLILLSYSITSAAWLISRTRQIQRRQAAGRENHG